MCCLTQSLGPCYPWLSIPCCCYLWIQFIPCYQNVCLYSRSWTVWTNFFLQSLFWKNRSLSGQFKVMLYGLHVSFSNVPLFFQSSSQLPKKLSFILCVFSQWGYPTDTWHMTRHARTHARTHAHTHTHTHTLHLLVSMFMFNTLSVLAVSVCFMSFICDNFNVLGTPEKIDPAALPLPQPAKSWVWLVDMERACSLLVGQLLGGMLTGSPLSRDEKNCEKWLNSPLLTCGLEDRNPDFGIFTLLRLLAVA